jgi:penicillin G amidase
MLRALAVLSLAVTLWGCGEDEVEDPEDLTRPPVDSPFAEARPPDSSAAYAGLSRQVEIITDEFGVPHIYAENQRDLAFAYGYAHARDRLFMMDALRMLGQGRISEYIGEVGMSFDLTYRATFMTVDGEQVSDAIARQLPAAAGDLLQAYANGVNAYLAELRGGRYPLPPDYSTPLLSGLKAEEILEWQPRDTIAVQRIMEWLLTDGAGDSDRATGELIQKLPPELFADLVRFQPSDPEVILPEWFSTLRSAPSPWPGFESRGEYLEAQARLQGFDFARIGAASSPLFGLPREPVGSNNWVVSGAHTKSGHPLVANDPHLSFVQPCYFHHAHLDTRLYGRDPASRASAIGIGVAGVSGLVIGHNENVAWGATVAGWDVTDLYIETLSPEGDAVLFNGDWVKIRRIEQTFQQGRGSGAKVETRVIEVVPHHGPILDGSKADGKALSVKWTGREVDQTIAALTELFSARGIDEWMKGLEGVAVLAQNWNGADVDGNIGYFPHAWIPIRKSVTGACAPYKPVDGTGPCEWIGVLPAAAVPQAKNPSRGWLVTANNDVAGTLTDNDPANDPQYHHADRDIGFRAARITQRIEEAIASGKKLTPDDMAAIQADNKSLEAERLLPHLFAAAEMLPDLVTELGLAAALTRLERWKLTTPSGVAADYRTDGGPGTEEVEESVAATIFYAWTARLKSRVLDDELGRYKVSLGNEARTRALLFLLEYPDLALTGSSVFDDMTTASVQETKEELMLEALSDALGYLASGEAFGSSDMTAWRWGELHRMEIRDLFGAFSSVAFLPRGPYPRGGAPFTVDPAGHGGDPKAFIFRGGPQMRFVAEVRPDGIVSRSSLPGGQSDDPDSPHYEDLLQLWLRNETFPYHFRVEDVRAHMQRYELLHP